MRRGKKLSGKEVEWKHWRVPVGQSLVVKLESKPHFGHDRDLSPETLKIEVSNIAQSVKLTPHS